MGDLSDLFKLSAEERIQLAEDLWDSVAAKPEQIPPLTELQRLELERRFADHASNPEGSSTWSEARARLWSRIA